VLGGGGVVAQEEDVDAGYDAVLDHLAVERSGEEFLGGGCFGEDCFVAVD